MCTIVISFEQGSEKILPDESEAESDTRNNRRRLADQIMPETARLMMVRSLLHATATLIACSISFGIFAAADMRMRMGIYAMIWIACGGAYFLVLYCKQCMLDTVDDRIRQVVRDQQTADELRRYQRRLRFTLQWRMERHRDDE